MNFNQAKDEFLKWAAPLLLTGILYTLGDLKSDMIQTKIEAHTQSLLLDRHSEQIERNRQDINDNKVKIGRLEIRVFGRDKGE